MEGLAFEKIDSFLLRLQGAQQSTGLGLAHFAILLDFLCNHALLLLAVFFIRGLFSRAVQFTLLFLLRLLCDRPALVALRFLLGAGFA